MTVYDDKHIEELNKKYEYACDIVTKLKAKIKNIEDDNEILRGILNKRSKILLRAERKFEITTLIYLVVYVLTIVYFLKGD